MHKLRFQFPTLADLLQDMSSAYKGRFISDDGYCMAYIMPIITFGHHVGDNYFEFDRKNDGFIFSFVSKLDKLEIARTSSHKLSEDLTKEEWNELIDEVLRRHVVKKEYLNLAQGNYSREFGRKSSEKGCMVTLIILAIVFIKLIYQF